MHLAESLPLVLMPVTPIDVSIGVVVHTIPSFDNFSKELGTITEHHALAIVLTVGILLGIITSDVLAVVLGIGLGLATTHAGVTARVQGCLAARLLDAEGRHRVDRGVFSRVHLIRLVIISCLRLKDSLDLHVRGVHRSCLLRLRVPLVVEFIEVLTPTCRSQLLILLDFAFVASLVAATVTHIGAAFVRIGHFLNIFDLIYRWLQLLFLFLVLQTQDVLNDVLLHPFFGIG